MSDPLDVIAESSQSLVKTLHLLVVWQEASHQQIRLLFTLVMLLLAMTLGTLVWLGFQHLQIQQDALTHRKQTLLFQQTLLHNTQTIAAQTQALLARPTP
jgi:uncharacterized protein HemX